MAYCKVRILGSGEEGYWWPPKNTGWARDHGGVREEVICGSRTWWGNLSRTGWFGGDFFLMQQGSFSNACRRKIRCSQDYSGSHPLRAWLLEKVNMDTIYLLFSVQRNQLEGGDSNSQPKETGKASWKHLSASSPTHPMQCLTFALSRCVVANLEIYEWGTEKVGRQKPSVSSARPCVLCTFPISLGIRHCHWT